MTQVLLSDGSYAIKVVVVGQSGNIAGGGGGGPPPSTADTASDTGATTVTASVTTANGVPICAANTGRFGGIITNDDANALYVLFGAGNVSSTNYSVKLYTDDICLIPAGYTGIIKGLWAADGSGNSYVTEFS